MRSLASMHLVLRLLAVAGFLMPAVAAAQVLIIDATPDRIAPLPRTQIIIYPPRPIPRPIPQPTSSYKIKELSMQAKLVDQVAKVQVTQSFVNTGSIQMEVCFVFPLPYDGAIEQMTLLVDGKEYPAKLLDAKAARATYEEIVRKNQDPALLEWLGTGMFKTSVFPVPPGAERKVSLRYSQLLRKNHGLTDFIFPLSTARYTSQPIENIDVQLAIDSSVDIKNIYSPSHKIEIKRTDDKHAVVSFSAKNEVPSADFRLFYDVGAGSLKTNILSYRREGSDEGYFLLLASPEIRAKDDQRPKKTVLFVVDRSGSMSGEKFTQAQNALKFVLNNLHEGDTFNIVAYDSTVESFRPELEKFNDETRKAALGFVAGLYAGGGTNIDGAISAALAQLKDTNRPTFLVFLTDGLPTAGETSEAKIVQNVRSHNQVRARMFAFGVGYDVNSRLLDSLARANFGQSEFVRPNEDIESAVSKLYNRIGAPVMTGVAIKYDFEGSKEEEGAIVNRVYPREVNDLFAGEQLVLAGRYKKHGVAKVVITGKVGDEQQSFDFPATFIEKSNDDTYAFVEKIWAMRRVGEIIDELDLKGKNEELVKELVELSTRHGILTPYTSFLADEQAPRRDVAASRFEANRALDALSESSGKAGVAQRAAKGDLQRAAQAPGAGFGSDGRAGGNAFYFDAKSDKRVAVQTVRTIGSKTFYFREGRWIDAAVTADDEKKAHEIKRFSDEYFDLASKHGKEVSKYLAIDEPVIIKLDGQVYSY